MAARDRVVPRSVWTARIAGVLFVLVSAGALSSALSAGCSGWDPSHPFERNSPEVDEALRFINSREFESAEQVLSRYLGTGVCADGGIGLPDTVRDKYNGSYDLGLVLFHIAEKYGRPFGEEEEGPDAGAEDPESQQRSLEIDCALIIVKAIAADPKIPADLRARARYLAGNLEFLRKRYEEAVKEYDESLALVPGIPEDAGGDGIGRDVAWNRSIALRRLAEQKDAGADSGEDGGEDADADADAPDSDDADSDAPDSPDGDDASDDADSGDADSGDDGGGDSGGDSGQTPDSGGEDAGNDGGDAGKQNADDDGGADGGDDKEQQPQPGDPEPADPKKDPSAPDHSQDDRILDRLEEAPTYQEEEAKKRAAGRRRGRMEDK
ncbi:MAG: hypothetical protein R3B70_35120 [Polyangiaceae bacterium]